MCEYLVPIYNHGLACATSEDVKYGLIFSVIFTIVILIICSIIEPVRKTYKLIS